MRGIPSLITEIRKKVFTEVARMAYSGDYTDMEDIPFKIVPGQSPLHRESVFLERAIAGERVRLAMGLSLQPVQTRTLLTEGMDQAAIAEQYYEPPLVNIIPYACHACPTRQYRVNELCQGCLASSCQRVCPKGAIKFVNGKSRIDQELCIKCGKCARSCPYNAITYLERPCQAACGMDAIGVDEYGKACIDYDRCVSCGQCLVSCPFGAIVDKSQIYQVIRSMLEGNEVVAIVAPSFVGQFGKDVTVPKFLTAMKQLGFADVVEVAVGADICTIEEARDFMEKVPEEQRFMATSCCPSWRMMARRLFPAESGNISMTYTPMVYTARLVKRERPAARSSLSARARPKSSRPCRMISGHDVDFVLTYEELMGILRPGTSTFPAARQPGPDGAPAPGAALPSRAAWPPRWRSSSTGSIPECQIKTQRADGLRECRKLLMLAKAGKLDGYLLEGMACPGGCVAGAGTVVSADTAAKSSRSTWPQATGGAADDSRYRDLADQLN
ncbi:MAG: monomeric [FeFe] hydrogenase [Oscillospiraceae bacterium]